MAHNIKTSIEARNAELDTLAVLANNGYIRIYGGAQPTNPETVASGPLLAELRFGSPAFNFAAGGIILANAITDDIDIAADGTATWFRVFQSDGTTALWDGSVDVADADLIVSTTTLVKQATLSITTLIYTLPQ